MKPLWRTSAWVISALPLGTLLILFAFALVAQQRVGHWPIYGRPDPKDLHLPVLHAASLLAYPGSLLGIIAGIGLFIVAPHQWSRRQHLLFLTGALAWLVSIRQTMILFDWLID